MSVKSGCTAIILHKDDPDHLREALKSVQWCEKRIVIDDHSTHSIESLATSSGAMVFAFPVGVDFAAARNFSASLVQTEWILWLDADETISPQLAQELRTVMQDPKVHGLRFRRLDSFQGRVLQYGETGAIRLIRAMRQGSGTWRGAVHEILEVEGIVKELHAPLLHTPHASVSTFLEKIVRYAEVVACERRIPAWRSWVELFLFPPAKFLVNFFWRQGWRDGLPGFTMAFMMSLHSLLVLAYRLRGECRNER